MKKQYLLFLVLALTLGSAFSQVPSYVPSSGLVGWWPFNGNANDASGNGNNGSTNNGVALTNDRFGNSSNAYSFDGINDNISIPHNTLFNFSSYSISIWVMKSGNGTAGKQHWTILMKNSSGLRYNDPFHISHTNSTVSAEFAPYPNQLLTDIGGGTPTTTNTIYPGYTLSNLQWDHILITFDNINDLHKIYINGTLFSTTTVNYSPITNSTPITLGYWPGYANYFNGKIDDLGLWNRALTQCEITDLYNTSLHTLTVSAGTDQTVCSGTAVTLAGSGASTYSWDNGVTDNTPFTPTTSGTYTVTGTDANTCTATDQVVVQVTELPIVTESTNTICPGTSVTLTASSPLSNKTPCTSEDLPLSLQSGLVGYWPFCGNANDESGNGNNGTVNGAALTTDRFGNANNAYSFDGVDDKITSSVMPNFQDFSVSFFFNSSLNLNPKRIIDMDNAGPYYFDLNLNTNGKLVAQIRLNNIQTDISSSSFVCDANWHYGTFVRNNNNCSLYVDGNLENSVTISTDLFIQPSPIVFGHTNLNLYSEQFYNGIIDDIGIWNRALTNAEVTTLYNIGNPTYSWSTAETAESISVNPTTTTNYSCDVTVNGQTCSDDVTINVIPNSSSSISETVCNNYTAPNGTVYTSSGTYTAVIPNAAGCDSTITINLTVNNATSSTITPTVCDTYTAPDGTVYTTSGTYTAVIPNAAGCDSTITINLTVNNATTSTIAPTVCDTYTAPDGTAYTTSGTYTAVIPNAAGCDSTITINLTLNEATSSTIAPTVCNTYTAPDGTIYTSSGTYTAVIPNAAGCDSTITINLTVNNATSSTITPTVCDTYTAPDGTVYTTSGTYTAIIPNAAGCDSTITINLTVNNATSSTISPVVCNTYTAPNGTVYTSSGTYTAVIPNAAGCDSTITINLTVNNATSSTITPTVCDTYTAPDGTVYTNSGTYTAIIPNAAGCDSTITINLTVKQSTSSTISPTVCNTYTAPNGTVYTSSGTYTAIIPNAAGCDSTITINLTVNNATSSTISPVVCNTYTAPNGTVYTSSGTYTAVIPNAAGCDSTITINLTVNNATSSTISPTVCNTYTAPNGTVYTSSGTYTAVIPNAAGCDSTITINLTVNNATTSTIAPTVCDTYTAPNGTVYTSSGTYTAVIPNAAGCDSTITINLTVNNATSSTISPTVCNTYTAPNGTVYTNSGTYTAIIPNTAGCDSTITINLTVNNATSSTVSPTVCNTYTAPNGMVYTSSGTYTAIIPNAAGCDSTITINLTVNNATSSTISPSVCNTYTAPDGTVYTNSGTYTAVIPNAAGCDSTITINLTVNNSLTVSAGSDQIVCEGTEVILTGSGASTYSWSNGVTNGVPFTPVQGVSTYIVTGTDANGCIGTDQVIVNAAALPTLDLNASTPTCAGETDANIYSQITSGSGTLDYVWNTGATTPDLLSVGSGTYVLTVTDAVGCVVGDTVTVSENPDPCFSIPGGVSPNGDNVNDTWTLIGIDKYPDAVIKVFNRWGQIIWSGDSESAGWDGTYEGKEMPTADYYYAIDLGNGEQYNGVVTLKR